MLKKLYCFLWGHIMWRHHKVEKFYTAHSGVNVSQEHIEWNTYCTRCGEELPKRESYIEALHTREYPEDKK
jgi:hypothetical protein